MDIQSLFIFLAMGAFVALWAQHSRISQRAISFANTICQQNGLQLLDQSVILVQLRPSLYRGMPCFKRRFRFEFSSRGDRRYYGWVTLKAWTLDHTELQPFTETPTL